MNENIRKNLISGIELILVAIAVEVIGVILSAIGLSTITSIASPIILIIAMIKMSNKDYGEFYHLTKLYWVKLVLGILCSVIALIGAIIFFVTYVNSTAITGEASTFLLKLFSYVVLVFGAIYCGISIYINYRFNKQLGIAFNSINSSKANESMIYKLPIIEVLLGGLAQVMLFIYIALLVSRFGAFLDLIEDLVVNSSSYNDAVVLNHFKNIFIGSAGSIIVFIISLLLSIASFAVKCLYTYFMYNVYTTFKKQPETIEEKPIAEAIEY